MASHMRSRPLAIPRIQWSLRVGLVAAVVFAALVMTISNIAVRAAHADGSGSFHLALPTVVLASNGQSANRIAVDTSELHSGKDVSVPVNVTNAGNQAISGVIASLAQQTPGIQLVVDAVSDPQRLPVAPGTTVQYTLRLHAIASLSQPKQVVVAFSPASSLSPAPAA